MLTFEKIRDLERAERDSKQLQKLPGNLPEELKDYMQKKEKMKSSEDARELENIKGTIKRFFELREQKLMKSIIYSIETDLPPENLTKEEETMFNEIIAVAKKHRHGFFSVLQQPEKKEPQDRKGFYRVKKTLPSFVGPDMKQYELRENDLISEDSIPKPLNDLLLKEGVIEKIELSQD